MSVPNYKKGVGKLVVDRYDFQNHIDGYSIKHTASAIEVSPPVIIETSTSTTVQEAIQFLTNAIMVDPDATTTSKGYVQLSGDIGGTATNITVTGLQGRPMAPGVPDDGYTFIWSSSDGYWKPNYIGSAVTLSGDVTGSISSSVVEKLNGNPISNSAPNVNDTLVWESGTWAPSPLPIFGDVSGSSAASTVTAIQGRSVSNNPPSDGYTLVWNGSTWIPQNLTITGDVVGTSAATTVTKIQGNLISSTAPTDGYVLIWDASGTPAWTPKLPSIPISGDVTGILSNATVTKIQNRLVNSTTPADGYALMWSAGDGYWKPQLPTIAGDVTGTLSNNTVVKIQGRSVNATAPTNGQTLNWSSSDGYWKPASFSTLYSQKRQTFPSTSIWTAPTNVYYVVLDGYGGGGGGGAGCTANSSVNWRPIGGGGGGGSLKSTRIVSVVPGTQYLITIGDGGSGGGISGESGGSGGDTSFALYNSPYTILAIFKGALGGKGGVNSAVVANTAGYAPGGGPTYSLDDWIYRSAGLFYQVFGATLTPPDFGRGPGFGGAGGDYLGNAAPQDGAISIERYWGGSGGSYGGDSGGGYYGGGGGGGGAGGPGGDGGNAGNGGLGNSGGGGGAGYAGSNAVSTFNTGAGGGGGGAGGSGSTVGGSFGAGGYGSSGFLQISWWDSA